MKKQGEWLRVRLRANYPDFRPILWPPPGPFWRSGIAGDESYSIVIAYVRSEEQIKAFWPESEIESASEAREITFSERFPKPDWWK